MVIHKKLWQKSFHDSAEYIEYYFEHKAIRSGVYSDYEEDKLCAMAYFMPYQTMFMGKKCKSHYIVGVATEQKCRHQKRMTKLLEQGIAVCYQEGSPLVFLSPEKPRVYISLGFVGTYWRETTTVNYGGSNWFRTELYSDLKEGDREAVAAFASLMLSREDFELYLIHSKEYYDEVVKEMQALDGDILILYDGNDIVGIANFVKEDGQIVVKELICTPERGKEIVETICDYMQITFLVIDDSHFISDVEGKGIRRERQEKPYIMYKITGAEESPALRCYINDLT